MSQIIFNNYIDMTSVAATPSSIGYTIGYDIDGILKQKDENGVVSPVGKASTQRLDETLSFGNQSGTYSLIMGTATSIGTSNVDASTRIYMDYNSLNAFRAMATASDTSTFVQVRPENILLSATYSTKKSTLEISSSTFSVYSGTSTYSTFIEATQGKTLTIGHNDTIIGSGGKLVVFDTGNVYDGIGSENKAYVHINAKGATTSMGVQNSVVIGGSGLSASRSNTVYLGNSVNINNAYTLPSTDGLANQVLRTNGSGTASWATFSVGSIPWTSVLAEGNTSGTYSVIIGSGSNIYLGTSSIIVSEDSSNFIDFSYTDILTPYKNLKISSSNGNYLSVSTASTTIVSATALGITFYTSTITSADGKGFQYDTDYTSTFEANSLITRQYVDNNLPSYSTNAVAYVDPSNGNDLTGEVGKPYRPYSNIANAIIGLTSSTYTSTSRGLVHLRKGTYTQIARLIDYIDYFCEPGVVFTQNGFRDYSAVNSNIYGYASFIGTDVSLIPLISAYGSNIRFEFDIVSNVQSFGRIYGAASTISIHGNRITTNSGSGYGIKIESSANVDIHIKEGITAAYETIYVGDGASGIILVESPYIRSNATLGSSGMVAGQVHALRVGSSVTAKIKVVSTLEDKTPSTSGNNSAALIDSGNVTIKGDIIGNLSYGLYLRDASGDIYVTMDGDVYSSKECIYVTSVSATLWITNSYIKSEGNGSAVVYILGAPLMYVSRCSIYCSTNKPIFRIDEQTSSLMVTDTIAYGAGVGGQFATCSFSPDYSIGFHNVRSNLDNSTNIVDSLDPSGFIYDTNIWVPYI